jgi:lysophospholipase L1-like esterase
MNKLLIPTLIALAAALAFVTYKAIDYRETVTALNRSPKVSYYREANKRQGKAEIVLIGDSIFFSFSGLPPEYVNRSIGGQTSADMLLRFRQDVVDLQPRVVVIEAGLNDLTRAWAPYSVEELKSNLMTMAELAREHNIKVVLASITPVCCGRELRRSPELIREVNGWMKEYAEREGHAYLDFHAQLADEKGLLKSNLTSDGAHPNEAGYAIMRQLIQDITRSL